MPTFPADGALGLDASFLRVAGSLDGGRIRHPLLAGRLVVAARLAQDLLFETSHPVETVEQSSAPDNDADAERRHRLREAFVQYQPMLADVTAALVRSGVWQPARTKADRLLRRMRYRDTNPADSRALVRSVMTGRRATDAPSAVLQELVHSYAPSSSPLTWWTTDPNFPVVVAGLAETTIQRLAELFETARAATPPYKPNAASAAQAGWQPSATS